VGKTRQQYAEELETLKEEVFNLGGVVADVLEASVRALSRCFLSLYFSKERLTTQTISSCR
jgi:hypothetical protein